MQDEDIDKGEFKPVSSIMLDFHNELDAYAHLKHHGVHLDGSVPECYGWIRLSQEHLKVVYKKAGCWGYLWPPKGVFGILLQYFPDAQAISKETVTYANADKAMRSLARIHQAYVVHYDIAPRNCLLKADGNPVWVDFDHAITPNPSMENEEKRFPSRAHRARFWMELDDARSFFYGKLVSESSYMKLSPHESLTCQWSWVYLLE